jgi:hypothetical protein
VETKKKASKREKCVDFFSITISFLSVFLHESLEKKAQENEKRKKEEGRGEIKPNSSTG